MSALPETRLPVLKTRATDDPQVVAEQMANDYSSHVVPVSARLGRWQLTMSFWSLLSAMVWLFYGALVAGLGSLGTALTDNAISAQEWVAVVSAFLVALGVVFAVPNKDPEAEHQEESVQPAPGQRILGKAFTGGTFSKAEEDARRDDKGRADVLYVLAVVVLVLVLLAFVGVL